MKTLSSFIFLALCYCLTLNAQSTYVVDDDGAGDYTTIKLAAVMVAPGDTILITGGADHIHTEDGLDIAKNLNFKGLGQHTTIVQAYPFVQRATDRIFNIRVGIDVSFQDFTIRNGNPSRARQNTSQGAAILAYGSNKVTFNRMSILNNRSDRGLGAVGFLGHTHTEATFTDCIIKDNWGNIGCKSISFRAAGTLTMERCTIFGNKASNGLYGVGGLELYSRSHTKLVNCTIAENEGSRGGAIYMTDGSSIDIINCTIVDNDIRGFWSGGGAIASNSNHYSRCTLTIVNSIIANNLRAGYEKRDLHLSPTAVAANVLTVQSSLIESCLGCESIPTFTGDAWLAPIAKCDSNVYYIPRECSDALGNGTAPGGMIPTHDICGNLRDATFDLGSYDVTSIPCFKPEASYSFSRLAFQVDFDNLTPVCESGVSWAWDFGDGNTSSQQSPTHTFALEGTYEVCLIVTNNCDKDTFCRNVYVDNCVPLPGIFNRDIGDVSGNMGDACRDINGVYTITTSGTGIKGTSDGFHYVYASHAGDLDMIARVTSIQNNANRQAGLMLRTSTSANAAHVSLVTNGQKQLKLLQRGTNGGATITKATTFSNKRLNTWLRLSYNQATQMVTAYHSSNGTPTSWQYIGTASMALTYYRAGMVASKGQTGAPKSFSLDNFSIDGTVYRMAEMPQALSLEAYPNPFGNQLSYRLEGVQGEVALRLFDLTGRTVSVETLDSNVSTDHEGVIDASGIAPGVYFLEVKTINERQLIKIVKR